LFKFQKLYASVGQRREILKKIWIRGNLQCCEDCSKYGTP